MLLRAKAWARARWWLRYSSLPSYIIPSCHHHRERKRVKKQAYNQPLTNFQGGDKIERCRRRTSQVQSRDLAFWSEVQREERVGEKTMPPCAQSQPWCTREKLGVERARMVLFISPDSRPGENWGGRTVWKKMVLYVDSSEIVPKHQLKTYYEVPPTRLYRLDKRDLQRALIGPMRTSITSTVTTPMSPPSRGYSFCSMIMSWGDSFALCRHKSTHFLASALFVEWHSQRLCLFESNFPVLHVCLFKLSKSALDTLWEACFLFPTHTTRNNKSKIFLKQADYCINEVNNLCHIFVKSSINFNEDISTKLIL